MKVLFILFSFIISSIITDTSSVGMQFPSIDCENYHWEKVNLPNVKSNKYTVIGIAFSTAAAAQLKTWVQPVYDVFKTPSSDTRNAFDMSVDYDVHLYFSPSFSKANKIVSKKVKAKIISKTDPDLQPYLLFLNINKEQKDLIAYDGAKVAYFVVIDPNGKIVYSTSGEYEESKVEAMIDIVDQ